MKALKIVMILLLITTVTNVMGQQIIECDSTTSYWVVSKGKVDYSVRLNGKAQSAGRPNLITINDYVLQNLIVNKKDYINKNNNDTDIKVLISYAMKESEYLSGQFQTKLNLQLQKVPLSEGRDALLWHFDMPAGMSEQVKSQIFVNIIIDDKIIGFGSPQFSEQEFDDVKEFLIGIISTAEKTKKISKLCDK